MISSGLRKILYSVLILGVCQGTILSANAEEIVHTKELQSINQPYEEDDDAVLIYDNRLGADYYEAEVKKNRPEFAIKNLGDCIKEWRNKKAEAASKKQKEKTDSISPMLDVQCDEMDYKEETNEIEARGNVVITSKSGIVVNADRALLNRVANTIKLFDNIVLRRDRLAISGDYMFVDLNEENALMDEPVTDAEVVVINAQEGYVFPDKIEYINGSVVPKEKLEFELTSKGFESYGRAINDKRLVDISLKQNRSKPYTFKAKQVVIRPERDHDSMVANDVSVYYKDNKILNIPSVEIFQDKEISYSEVNFPLEISSIKGLGMYAGLGYTFKLPKDYTYRLTVIGSNSKGTFGIGGIARIKSKKLNLEGAWTTNTNNLIIDGRYDITDKISLDGGRHAYKNEWLSGGNRAGYVAELNYDDVFIMRDLANARFRHRLSAGYVADYKREHQEDDMKDGTRFRYQAELSKYFRTIGSKEQDMYVNFGAVGQVMSTLYSQGDTNAFFRVGPAIESRYKRWSSTILGTLGGIHGRSPYSFDEYRYGRQTISFDESLILSRFISLGYKGTLTPLKDNSQHDLLTENRFYVIVGPEDMKIAVSYDSIRSTFKFDFLFLLGSDNMKIDYEKLIVNDPDSVGRRKKKYSDRELYKVKVPEVL